MIEYNKFTEKLTVIKDIITYNQYIEKTVSDALKKIFKNTIKREKPGISNYFYDFSVGLGGFRLFCEIKKEKGSLIFFWKKRLPFIYEYF